MSNDLISRQAALYALHLLSIEALKKHRFDYDALITICSKKIKNLPSVQQEQNLAYWIGAELGECSSCGHSGCASDIWNGCEQMFCPNCGAKMKSEGEK